MKGIAAVSGAAGAGVFMAWVYWYLSFRERRPDAVEDSYGRWRMNSLLLPASMVALLVLAPKFLGAGEGPHLGALLAQLLLWLSLVFAALLLVLPALRRVFPSQACAMLWTLPLEGWLFCQMLNARQVFPGEWIVYVPAGLLGVLVWASVAGFVLLGGYFIFRHIRFRRTLLSGSRPETDETVLALWQAECERVKWTSSMHLRRTPGLETPLALGMFLSERYVFLPERSYHPEELRLIFRHELCHLVRHDPEMKLFQSLSCALCWWNPLVWWAAQRAAEDKELACDEFVTRDMRDPERRAYAELLLGQTGPVEGFTSCLSSRAQTLRHRMKGVLCGRPRHGGAFLIGVAAALMVLAGGVFCLADERGRVEEMIYPHLPLEQPVESAVLYLSKEGEVPEGWKESLLSDESSAWYQWPLEPAGLLERLAGEEAAHLLPKPVLLPTGAVDWYVRILWDEGDGLRGLKLTPSSLSTEEGDWRLTEPLTLEELWPFLRPAP